MIEIRDLIVIYQAFPMNIIANRGIDLDIEKKGIKVITGPNGSGKSTLFKVLSGEIQPSAGEIKLKGKLLSKKEIPKTLSGMIEYAKQDLLLNPEWSGARYQKTFASLDQKNLTKLLNALDIEDYWQIPIRELTRDQRQLVGLTLTLLSSKPILLLDEPTKYLNNKSRSDLLKVIKELSQKKSVLVATHDPFWTSQSKEAVHIQEGRVVQIGKKNSRDEYGWQFSGKLEKPRSLKQLKKHKNIEHFDELGEFIGSLKGVSEGVRLFDPELTTFDEVTPSELFTDEKIKLPAKLSTYSDQRIRTLSGGERSWTYVYSLLASKPKEIFLLYPTLNLDQENQEVLQKLVIDLADKGSKIKIFDID